MPFNTFAPISQMHNFGTTDLMEMELLKVKPDLMKERMRRC